MRYLLKLVKHNILSGIHSGPVVRLIELNSLKMVKNPIQFNLSPQTTTSSTKTSTSNAIEVH